MDSSTSPVVLLQSAMGHVASSVDVVVPCYRYGCFLRECVETVLAQEGVGVRVLIIDDASPDNTPEVASALCDKDPRVKYVRHVSNKGHIDTYNEGIEWASAGYFLLLSADDYLLPGALRRAVHVFEAHPEVGMVMGKAIELFDGNELPRINEAAAYNRPLDYRIMSGREFMEFSGSRNRVPTPTAVVRTKLQKQLGGYRPELPHSGDMEMWLRFAAHANIGILDAHQAVYRHHSSNMSAPYMKESWLPDLLQREAAIHCFLQSCGDVLPNRQQIQWRLLRSLGLEALKWAGDAFHEGQRPMSEELSEFAFRVCPQVRRSFARSKLTCKRLLGVRTWRTLRPMVTNVKRSVSSFREWGRSGHPQQSADRVFTRFEQENPKPIVKRDLERVMANHRRGN